jgi:hypothetical protein
VPLWDSADLLRRAKNLARRPAVDQAVADAKWFDWMTEAQEEVYSDVFSRFPDFGYSAAVQLITQDGGFTYIFGLDADNDPLQPFGHVELYANQTSIPDSPLVPGYDFIFEGGRIRFPAGKARTYANGGGPWARFVADPTAAITAASNPQLQPKEARMLLVYKALEQWASRRGSGSDPAYWEDRYNKRLMKLIMRLSTAYNMQGAQAAGADAQRAWWYSGDFSPNQQGAEGAQQYDSNQYA